MLVSLRYLMRRTVAGRRELVWNPTSFIRGQLMHTNTAAGKSKNFLGLYVGTNHVGVSLCDAKYSACIALWPPLNRNKDMITLARELKKLIEKHKVWLLVVGRPWITEQTNHFEMVAKKNMEEHRIAGFVMCPVEGQDENHSSDEVAMVESFIKDLTNTGVLTGFKCFYYTARVFVSPWTMKRKIEELKLSRDPRFLLKDWTELEDFHAMYASEFMLLHYVRYFVIPFLEKKGVECTIKRRTFSAIVEEEILPNVYAFFVVP